METNEYTEGGSMNRYTTTKHEFGTTTVFEGGYYTKLGINPNGFWGGDVVTVMIDTNMHGEVREWNISWSSGGFEADYPIVKRTLNFAAALVFATEWAEATVEEFNNNKKEK